MAEDPNTLTSEEGIQMQIVGEGDPDDPALEADDPNVARQEPEAKASAPVEEPEESEGEDEEDATKTAEKLVDAELEDMSEEELDQLEKDLDGYIDERLAERMRPELAGRDRTITRLSAQVKEQETAQEQLRKDIRDSKMSQLTPEEQAKLRQEYDWEDRKEKLDRYQSELDDLALTIARSAYVQDYGDFGVTADDMAGMNDESAMEAFCHTKELDHWRAIAKGGESVKPRASAKVEDGKPAPKAEGKKAPAGAKAPTDLGGESPPGPKKGPVEGTGPEALAKSLNQTPYETIKIGG